MHLVEPHLEVFFQSCNLVLNKYNMTSLQVKKHRRKGFLV